MFIVYLGPNAQGITFVASKLVVQSFLCALDAVQRNNSEFRGENKQKPVISCALIVYSLGFWKDNFIELAVCKKTVMCVMYVIVYKEIGLNSRFRFKKCLYCALNKYSKYEYELDICRFV